MHRLMTRYLMQQNIIFRKVSALASESANSDSTRRCFGLCDQL